MSDTLFDMTPYKSKAAHSYSPDWIDTTGTDPSWDETESHKDNENSPALFLEDVQDNFTKAPIMAEQKTLNARHATAEVVEELSKEESADRQRLELKVERAFYDAALALKELHDRKLYRSTHSRFDHYCRDRFGFSQQNADLLIRAARVIDNLKVTTNGCNFLPTSERQKRPLTKLKPDEQRQVWSEAVDAAGGKVPSGRVVKGLVSRLKERNITPPPIPFQKGDVVLIRGLGDPQLKKYDGQWTLALAINEFCVTIALNGKDISVKPQFLEAVDPKYWFEIKAVHKRITRLQLSCDLDPAEDAVLEVLRRRTCFTQRQMLLLERMENDYGVV